MQIKKRTQGTKRAHRSRFTGAATEVLSGSSKALYVDAPPSVLGRTITQYVTLESTFWGVTGVRRRPSVHMFGNMTLSDLG